VPTVTPIAKRSHCERTTRFSFGAGGFPDGSKIRCRRPGRSFTARPICWNRQSGLPDKGRRSTICRRHGRSWHAPTLQRAYHRRPQSSGITRMNSIAGCREIEALCRRRAVSDRVHSWKWLGEADRWNDLAHREIASRFQNNPVHAGPMAMGRTRLTATRTDRSMSRCSGCNL
jgi:hypothetical protein